MLTHSFTVHSLNYKHNNKWSSQNAGYVYVNSINKKRKQQQQQQQQKNNKKKNNKTEKVNVDDS